MAKVFTLLRCKEEWSQAEFSDYWGSIHKEHALDLARAGFFSGYVQNHLLAPPLDPDWPVADGIPEIWVPSIDSLAEIAASDIYRQGAEPDEANFTDGNIRSYIHAEGGGQGARHWPAPSATGAHIRYMAFMQGHVPAPVIEVAIPAGGVGTVDILNTLSASDGVTPCLVISGFCESIAAAQNILKELVGKLLATASAELLSAGVYDARTVVDPQTGQW